MGAAVLTLTGTVTGIPAGEQILDVIWNLPAAVGQVTPVTLFVGDNPIAIPATARAVLISPPSNNLVTITMKRDPRDIGMDLDLTLPSFPSLGQSMTTFYLTVTALLTGPVSIAFW